MTTGLWVRLFSLLYKKNQTNAELGEPLKQIHDTFGQFSKAKG